MKVPIYLFCVLIVMLVGCSGRPEDPRLLDIAGKVSDSPEEMLARLDSIDASRLKEADRWFHALLRVKAQDKAFVRHTSDSVILGVVDYYSGHRRSGLYPEALYYGGRVYSDLGDAPSALRYFHDALDAIPEGKDDDLRKRIYSQMGDLLNSLRLYSEAAACINEAIKLDFADSDSLKLMRAIRLLGAVYMHSGDYGRADSCFRKAREIGSLIHDKDTIIHDMYIAGNELYKGNVNSALSGIREVLHSRKDIESDIVDAYALHIYLEAHIPDTAYQFATKLIRSRNNDRRRVGYGCILGPELIGYCSDDSLVSYALAFNDVLKKYLDRHDAQQTTTQVSLYNYSNHERARKKAEESRRFFKQLAVGAVFLVIVLCFMIMYLRNRSMKTILKYRKALDDISSLRKALDKNIEIGVDDDQHSRENINGISTGPNPSEESQSVDDLMSDEEKEKNMLRERLKQELLTLQKAGEAKKEIAESILASSAYDELKKYIKAEKPIPDSDSLWCELEKEVMKVSPEFKYRLYLLAGDRLKEDAYHMALLVRCGVTPTELAVLIGRSKGAVSSRRGYICEMIFGQKLGAKVMDDIIRLL